MIKREAKSRDSQFSYTMMSAGTTPNVEEGIRFNPNVTQVQQELNRNSHVSKGLRSDKFGTNRDSDRYPYKLNSARQNRSARGVKEGLKIKVTEGSSVHNEPSMLQTMDALLHH